MVYDIFDASAHLRGHHRRLTGPKHMFCHGTAWQIRLLLLGIEPARFIAAPFPGVKLKGNFIFAAKNAVGLGTWGGRAGILQELLHIAE